MTYQTSFTMRRATGLTLQPHQTLRLPRKMACMIDARHIWNVICNARSITLQPHQILRLPRKIAAQNLREICRKQLKCHLKCAADSSMIRAWSEHRPSSRTRPFDEVNFRLSRFGDAVCIENYNISRSGYLPRFHQILRLQRKVTLQF